MNIKSNRKDIIAIIVTGIVGVVAYICSMRTSVFGAYPDDPTAILAASLGLSMLFLVIGERIATKFRNDSAIEKIETVCENKNNALLTIIRSEIEGEIFENTAAAHKYANDILDITDKVLNTTIRIPSKNMKLNRFYATELIEEWNRKVANIVSDGGTYHEIFSENIKGRITDMEKLINNAGGSKDFRAWVLKSNAIPFTNFIIFYKNNIPIEVLYGWAFDDDNIHPHVFLSRSEKLIVYFEKQFQVLKAISDAAYPKS